MIQVTYDWEHCRMTIEGHAHSAEPGHDLVCAAVSALVYTLAANVRELESGGKVHFAYARLESGDAEIGCTPKGKHAALVGCILNAVCVGFEMLARQYPEYISYEIHGQRDSEGNPFYAMK